MKYHLIPSKNTSNTDSIFIYILPSGFENSSYLIAYPEFKADDILSGRIIIRTFDGCSSDAVGEIRSKLKSKLQDKIEKYSDRINTLFALGIGTLVLGIVNCVIPDPLPFIDELLFIIGGGFTAWKSWNDRKKKLPVLSDRTYRYGYEGKGAEVETDINLTSIFKGIRCKIDPEAAGETIRELDKIEIECLWLTKYINKEKISESEKSDPRGIRTLIKVIERVFPLNNLVKLERKKQSLKILGKLEILRQETIQKTGSTNDALAVYCEFYRTYKQ